MDIALTDDMRRNLYLLDAVQKSKNIRLRREASKYHWRYLYLGPVLMGLSLVLGLSMFTFGAIAIWMAFFSDTSGQTFGYVVLAAMACGLGFGIMLIGEFFCDRVDDKMYKFKCEDSTVNNLRDLEVEYAKALTESIESLSGMNIVTNSVSYSLSKYAFYRQEATLDGERVFFSFDYANGMLKITPTPATIKSRALATAS